MRCACCLCACAEMLVSLACAVWALPGKGLSGWWCCSAWRGRRQAPGQKGPVLDLASLRQLFDRLGEEEDPDKLETARGLRYLVALLLLRKRWLKMVDAQNPEQESADMLVVDPKAENMEPVALSAPALDTEAMSSLKEELLSVLDQQQEPIAEENCESCHKRHGFTQQLILQRELPELCLECHEGHVATQPITVLDREAKGAFYTRCTDCHSQIHGTDIPSPSGRGTFVR